VRPTGRPCRTIAGVDTWPRVEIALAAGAELGEGPSWDAASGTLVWVDILAGRVHRLDPPTGTDRELEVGQAVGHAVPRAGGGLVLGLRDGFALLDAATAAQPDGTTVMPRFVAPAPDPDPSMRANDGKCDAQGRIWAGTMAFDPSPGRGSLVRLDPDGTLTRHLAGLTIANGMGWSPDGRTLYFIDSAPGAIDAFDFDADPGTLARRRPFARITAAEGQPDGLAVAADGSLFVAVWGGGEVRRYGPDGSLVERLPVPVAQPTSCCFGGADLADLYVTSARQGLTPDELGRQPHAGDVLVLRPGVTGLPTTPFAG
jgi:sugar lactone lactonase YvrE